MYSLSDTRDIYTSRSTPRSQSPSAHPRQTRRRRAMTLPPDSFDPQAPVLLHVWIHDPE